MTRTHTNTDDSKRFEAMLLAKRNEILKNVSELQDEALHLTSDDGPRFPNHPADIGTDYYDLENTIGLLEGERQILWDIDQALERMEKGSYGDCEVCQKQIPAKRLEAIPWTPCCVGCADFQEKNNGGPARPRLHMRNMPQVD